MITIKKYSNRKLYNTISKQYINLNDILSYVDTKTKFVVFDNETNSSYTLKEFL